MITHGKPVLAEKLGRIITDAGTHPTAAETSAIFQLPLKRLL